MKHPLHLLVAIIASLSLSGCNRPQPVVPVAKNASTPIEVENGGRTLKFAAPPQRVIATGQGAAELLLELGQAKSMVGVYYGQQTAIPPHLAVEFKQLSVLSETAPPSKEIAIALRPDLVVAQFPTRDLNPAQGAAAQSDFEQSGVQVFLYSATTGNPAEATYAKFLGDVLALGKIFQVETRARELVNDFQQQMQAAREQTAGKPRVKVALVFATTDQSLGVFGSGLLNELLEAAGCENVYRKEQDSLINAAQEDFAERPIACYILPDYPQSPDRRASVSFEWLCKEFPNLPASRERRYVAIEVGNLNVGLRNIAAIEQLVRELHPTTQGKTP